MPRFDKSIYLSLLFKFILSERLRNSLWGSDVLLLQEFIHIVSILFYNCIEFIILLCNFLVIPLSRYKEYICLISFSKFSNVLPAFICTSAIGNLWSIWLGVNILSCIAKSFNFLLLIKVEDFFSIIDYFIWLFIFRDFFLKIAFLKSINPSIVLYTKRSFLAWLALLKLC